jgi:CTP synthase (UTP-ammonia lyase)
MRLMRRQNTNEVMTVAEVHRRLRAIKRMLGNRNQVLYYQALNLDCLQIDLTDVESFYTCPIHFDKAQFLRYIGENKNLFNRDNFISGEVLDYVSNRKKTICRSFSVTAMLFTKYRDFTDVKKHVIVCLGSIYHAPRLFYKDIASGRIVYEKCSEYTDLR